ncbi:NUDIX hydrolase [Saccharomonospora sp. CUA-673]|uniref:NUDIX hydrolase n=1 Tax=Saccharomonospora sp. CUA-673 TaxID=1904969 RepID=UPI0009676E79|nr:NUDIX hydrolase [Saccharomonospora sp. CUA-673]OLT46242.1 NUDIX hydrolase [Saccharomonospora sp. CUA-673]
MSTTTADRIASHAAGAVLWRPAGSNDTDVEIAVVHRPRYDDWSLPKGHLDPGETAPVAAVRELEEETGHAAVLGAFLKRVEYRIARGRKAVDYFAARAGDEVARGFTPNDEVDQLRWHSPSEARELLSYDSDVEVVKEFAARPTETTTVLLVRHAKAGKRENWAGDDDLRPLSDAGRRQASALREMLATFGPDRVLSAPLLRCVHTVQGVADDIGVEVVHDDALSERSYAADPDAPIERIGELAAEGGTPVLSSQGGVIPYIVETLAVRDGVTPRANPPAVAADGVTAKKGSLWQLTFDADGRLVDATYLSSALPTPTAA